MWLVIVEDCTEGRPDTASGWVWMVDNWYSYRPMNVTVWHGRKVMRKLPS